MHRIFKLFLLAVFFGMTISVSALSGTDQDSTFKPHGKVWGLGFGDFAYKHESDPFGRGATNQYTGIAKGQSMFQFRRIYFGYDYEISEKFSSQFLLAMEDNLVTSASSAPVTSGDLLSNGKYSLFIKNANVSWNNIFKGSRLSLGMLHTPAAVLLPEVVWDYRCIERTISELRRTPAWDMGLMLSGNLYKSEAGEIGYNLMVGNGSGSKPENNAFKWFYGDVWFKLFGKRLIVDLYADFNRTDLDVHDRRERTMFKGLVAWSTPKFTIGVEAFTASLRNEVLAMRTDSTTEKTDISALNYSVFMRGRIYKDKLGFFARYDAFDPTQANSDGYLSYNPLTPQYNPNYTDMFVTAGLDYTPIEHIHIMPNIWMTQYANSGSDAKTGTDLVMRLSIYYVYGK